MTDFVFLPKPEGDRHVEVRVSYKRLVGDKESVAALLSVLEFLAKETLMHRPDWQIGDAIPESIIIDGDCNYPRINALMDGWLKPTSLRDKLQELARLGLISIDTETQLRHRLITFHYRVIADKLATINLHPPKPGPSKKRTLQNLEGKTNPPKFGGSKKWGSTLQNLEPNPPNFGASTLQNLDPSRSLVDLLVDQKEDPEPLFSFSAEETGTRSEVASGDRCSLASKPASLVNIQNSEGDQCSAVPVDKIAQADYEILQPGERQDVRLRGRAIALDPWILETPDNQSKVLADQVTRCSLNSEFGEFLTQQLAQSPYWQNRPDEPPTNSGIRQIKDLYAIPAGPQRDAEREKMQGMWDKWQALVAQCERNKALRSARSLEESIASVERKHEHVPFSQLPEDQQVQIRATLANLKTIASVGLTRIAQPMPVSVSPSAPPQVESVEPSSRLEQIMSLAEGPVRDRALQAYYQQQVDGGGVEAIRATPREPNVLASQGSKTSLQPLMSALNDDIYAQAGF